MLSNVTPVVPPLPQFLQLFRKTLSTIASALDYYYAVDPFSGTVTGRDYSGIFVVGVRAGKQGSKR